MITLHDMIQIILHSIHVDVQGMRCKDRNGHTYVVQDWNGNIVELTQETPFGEARTYTVSRQEGTVRTYDPYNRRSFLIEARNAA